MPVLLVRSYSQCRWPLAGPSMGFLLLLTPIGPSMLRPINISSTAAQCEVAARQSVCGCGDQYFARTGFSAQDKQA